MPGGSITLLSLALRVCAEPRPALQVAGPSPGLGFWALCEATLNLVGLISGLTEGGATHSPLQARLLPLSDLPSPARADDCPGGLSW